MGPLLLVEAGSPGTLRIGETIPPETRMLLSELGVWDAFDGEGHEPCLGSCSSWGDDQLGYNDFLFNPHGTGWHLDRRRFDALLASKVAETGGATWSRARFTGARPLEDGGFQLRLTASSGDRRTVRARFVVDAMGASSPFARAVGARRLFHDRLSCVAGFLEIPQGSSFTRLTMLEAVEYGWWYTARLPGRRLAVVVGSDPEIVKRARLHTPDAWRARLDRTRHLARELRDCGFSHDGLLARSAASFLLEPVGGEGWVAVGDAASAFDPISSQGIYKALLGGIEAADVIEAGLAGRGAAALETYRRSVAGRFKEYLANRNYFYGLERRWESSPFWARRRRRQRLKRP